MLLKDVGVGMTCTVEEINLPTHMVRRLEALGMTKGARVSVLNKKGKGIIIVKLRGARFALGYHITRNIEVGCGA